VRERLLTWPLATLVYFGLALWTLYPAYLDTEHILVGDWRHPDMLSNHWLYAWVAERLLAGESILHNTDYYFPIGDHPWLAGNGSDAVLATPLHALVGWPGSVTFWLLLVLTANGVAGRALCRAMGGTNAGSLFGGATIALCAYVCHELAGGRFSQVPLWAFAGFLAAWIRLLDRPTVRMGVLAGVLYAVGAFLYWYYGLWAAGVAAVFLLFRRPTSWIPVAACAAVATALTLPPLALFLKNWALIPGTAAEVFPHPLAMTSGLPATFVFWGSGAERGEVTLSLIAVGLAGWGLYKGGLDWRAKALGVAGIAFFLLALGPELLAPSGEGTGVPGPFRLAYGSVGVLQRYWWPYRHVVVVGFAVAAFASRALPEKLPLALGLVVLLPIDLIARDGTASAPSAWWEPPEAYLAMAEAPGEAVLELPIAPQVVSAQQTLTYQMVHQKKLVNGHAMWVDRVRPDAWDDWVADNSFLTVLGAYERGELMTAPFAFRPEHVVALRSAGVRYIVVNAEYFPRALYGLVERYPVIFEPLFGEPVYTFRDHLWVWDLERYTHVGLVEDVPAFGLPEDYRNRDGSAMLDVGHGRALGLRGLARLFPPTIPPQPIGEGDDLGAAPGEDRR